MTKFLLAALLLATCGAYAGDMDSASTGETAKATDATTAAGDTAEPFKMIHVADLSGWMDAKDQKVYIFDANNKKVRMTQGMIPGAKPLSSSDKYVVASTLPSDKSSNVVFYCASDACTASHNAAKRAMDAGYTNVSVMADGIAGWVKAGKPVTKSKKS